MADESYIRELSSTLKDRIKADEQQTQKENREEEIMKVAAPKDWMRLKAYLKESVAQLNEGLPKDTITCTEGSSNEVMLHCQLGQKRGLLSVKFSNLLGGMISLSGNGIDLSYMAEVERGTLVWTVSPKDRITLEEIEKRILNAATNL